ncbi:MAG: ABC transporter ATP-binding protein, partial [Candidatus Puniceispirillaceae bacterium]
TVLIVSHDRDFLDRTVTGILAFEGEARVVAHAGGYSDYLARKKATEGRQTDKSDSKKSKESASDKPKINRPARLSFRDKYRLDTLPDEVAAIDAKIALIETKLAVPDLFQNDPDLFNRLVDMLAAQKDSKDQKEIEWLEAAEKAEALEQDGNQN